MLNRCENDVMKAVYCLCDGMDGCLISPMDIISILPVRRKYSTDRLDDALNALQSDGYLDVISSERKGEKMYVISLKENGANYRRRERQRRQDLLYKLFLGLFGAFATFIFGLIIKAIFKT